MAGFDGMAEAMPFQSKRWTGFEIKKISAVIPIFILTTVERGWLRG
jgi:hypothetical protein